MNSGIRLKQQGYKLVATFILKERADMQAAYMRKLGHKANVVTMYNNHGEKIYGIYFKAQEA